MTFLRHDLGDGAALVLRDLDTVPELHRLTLANLERLRRWENWAHADQTEESTRIYTRYQLSKLADGTALPLAIEYGGRLVGSVGARIDLHREAAEIGYWIDEAAEGRGLVTRSVDAVVDHLARRRDVHRFEIRTAAHNVRSRAVAERCGFTLEGVLRAAFRVGPDRHDVALYARIV
jgi:ribosomal-protein-serine acetyltransferase